jgi:hypothetical protein
MFAESLKERNYSEDCLRDEGNIKVDLKERVWGNWIQVAQDRGQCRALVNTLMNLRG